jgi:hypothetical protein
MKQAEALDLPLPDGWSARFPCDPLAPSVGNTRGWGKLFVIRSARRVGADRSEQLHPSILARGGVPPRWQCGAGRVAACDLLGAEDMG